MLKRILTGVFPFLLVIIGLLGSVFMIFLPVWFTDFGPLAFGVAVFFGYIMGFGLGIILNK